MSSRGDLLSPNVSEPFYLQPACFGGIDAKISASTAKRASFARAPLTRPRTANNDMMKNNSFVVVGGPTYGGPDNLPPFVWSTSPICAGVDHFGIVDRQQFQWFLFDRV